MSLNAIAAERRHSELEFLWWWLRRLKYHWQLAESSINPMLIVSRLSDNRTFLPWRIRYQRGHSFVPVAHPSAFRWHLYSNKWHTHSYLEQVLLNLNTFLWRRCNRYFPFNLCYVYFWLFKILSICHIYACIQFTCISLYLMLLTKFSLK